MNTFKGSLTVSLAQQDHSRDSEGFSLDLVCICTNLKYVYGDICNFLQKLSQTCLGSGFVYSCNERVAFPIQIPMALHFCKF